VPAADAESEADDVARPSVEFVMLIEGAVSPANLSVKEREPIGASVVSPEEGFSEVRKANALREVGLYALLSHGRSPERQPYGNTFMSPYPIAV
jgi:hypothetical protein